MKAKDLKNSILQMAIEGKLVAQDPADEPASALLERIREERRRLVAEGKAKFPKAGESVIYAGPDGAARERRVDAKGRVLSDKSIADEVPFAELPEGWAWARIGCVAEVQLGKMLDRQKNQGASVPYLGNKNVRWGDFDFDEVKRMPMNEADRAKFKLRRGDLMVCEGGVPGRCAIWHSDQSMYYQKALHRIRCSEAMLNSYCEMYLGYIIRSHLWDSSFTGTTIKHLPAQTLSNWPIPLPPLAEQHRIVERVGELMPLVEEYGKLEDARRALDEALPARLRTSVLQEAVQGKLVPQDPADEPASILLEGIREERRRLVAEGKAKFPKAGESLICAGPDGVARERRVDAKGRVLSDKSIADEVPFADLPEGWAWARIGALFEMGAGKNIKASEISEQATEDRPYRCFGGNGVRGYVATYNQEGDYPIVGRQGALCGNVRRATGRFYATEHAVVTVCPSELDVSWACLFLTALNLNQYATATAQPGLAVSKVVEVLIPLPPLAEQRRIVERVGELMPLVDGFAELEG